MNMHQHIQLRVIEAQQKAPSRSSILRRWATTFAAWMKRCADRYSAVCAYEDLSRLSDAELRHLGLSRDVLARDLDR